MRYLLFLIFLLSKHFSINIVKTWRENIKRKYEVLGIHHLPLDCTQEVETQGPWVQTSPLLTTDIPVRLDNKHHKEIYKNMKNKTRNISPWPFHRQIYLQIMITNWHSWWLISHLIHCNRKITIKEKHNGGRAKSQNKYMDIKIKFSKWICHI